MSSAWVIAFVGLMVFLAHAFMALFRKTRVPDVLLLITIGILLGPVSGLVHPRHFGAVGPIFAQVALAIILFEGGHDTQFEVLRKNWKSCLLLTFPTFLASFILGTTFLRVLTGMEYESCFLFGAILGSTSPSVVVPLVKQLRLRKGPAIVLTMESAIADVLCLVLVLGFMEAHAVGQIQVSTMLVKILLSFGVAGLIGVLAGLLWSTLLSRIRAIQNNIFMTLALVFVLYGTLDAFHLSGGVAALAFGMTVGNASLFRLPSLRGRVIGKPVHFTSREKAFFSEAVFLIKTFFFLYLGISLHFTHFQVLFFAFCLVAAVHLLRLPIVLVAMPRAFSRRDASLISVMAPKGLAAAVLAALPSQQGWVGGEFIQELSYSIILFSIVGASVSVFLLESTPLGAAFRSLFRSFAAHEASPAEEASRAAPAPIRRLDEDADEGPAPTYSAGAPS